MPKSAKTEPQIDTAALAERTGMDAAAFEPAEDQPAASSLKAADRTAGPFIDDAEPHDPPVRTNRPDEPVLTSLAVGAGQHRPETDPDIDPAGRYNPGWAEEGPVIAGPATGTVEPTTAGQG